MFSSDMSLHSRLRADVTDAPERAVTVSKSYFFFECWMRLGGFNGAVISGADSLRAKTLTP